MTHQWHDSYRHQTTPAHHLDPRSKLFVGMAFIGIVLLTPRFNRIQAACYPALIVVCALLAGIAWKPFLARILTVLPFALVMLVSAFFSHASTGRMIDILAKAGCSIAVMSLLILTTPFPDLLRALEQLRVPSMLVMFLAFLYRYGEVLYEEAAQLERAWAARYFGRFWFRQWFHMGHVLAALFVRSYERAERVFAAMQARGFSRGAAGVRLLHFGIQDAVFVGLSLLCLAGLRWGRF
jgi:cobalt/nickel transport system permease protein